MNLLWIAVTAGLFFIAEHAAADGICKRQRIPPGYMPVAEFNSPQCESANPFDLNAWELAPVRNGIVSCSLPDYDSGDATVIGYIPCKTQFSAKCSKKLDGTANAYVLSSPAACEDKKTVYVCAKYSFGDPDSGVVDQLYVPHLFLIKNRSSAECPSFPHKPFNQQVFRRIDIDEKLPVCKESFPLMPGMNQIPLRRTVPAPGRRPQGGRPLEKQTGHGLDREYIIRKFHDPNCPSDSGDPRAVNAYVIQRIKAALDDNRTIFVCLDSVPTWSWTPRFHDDRCGTGKEPNAINFKLSHLP